MYVIYIHTCSRHGYIIHIFLFARWNLHEIIYGYKFKNGYHLFIFLSCMLVT